MVSEGAVMGLSLVAVVIGLVVVLFGLEELDYTFVQGGGVVALLGVGAIALYLATLEAPGGEG